MYRYCAILLLVVALIGCAGGKNTVTEPVKTQTVTTEQTTTTTTTTTTTSVVRPALTDADGDTLEDVVRTAVYELTDRVGTQHRIGVIEFIHPNSEISNFITKEIESNLTSFGYTVVNRAPMDRLKRDMNPTPGGDITSAQAITLGRYGEADVVLFGRIDGARETRRLRLEALRIPSGEIMGSVAKPVPEN